MKYILSIIALAVLISCGGKKEKPFVQNFETVAGPDSLSFHGAQLGQSYGYILDTESPDLMEYQDSNMIRYNLHYSDSEEYKIAYRFTGDFLTQIQVDMYLGEINDGKVMIGLLKKRFDKKYGFGEEQQGILTWNKGGESVELTDESEVFDYGKVLLLIFQTPKDPAPRPEAIQ